MQECLFIGIGNLEGKSGARVHGYYTCLGKIGSLIRLGYPAMGPSCHSDEVTPSTLAIGIRFAGLDGYHPFFI